MDASPMAIFNISQKSTGPLSGHFALFRGVESCVLDAAKQIFLHRLLFSLSLASMQNSNQEMI